MPESYDAILLLSFGGPEGMDDVIPFLENVLRGRNVPRERLEEVAEHYRHYGGVSPINEQNRALIAALETELRTQGVTLPIYWGNRNWKPYLTDTLRRMQEDGIKEYLALVTSGFSCFSGCRQYRENLEAAQDALGDDAPEYAKIRVWYNHPEFIATHADHIRTCLDAIPGERRADTRIAFTAHSIPLAMAEKCDYEIQLLDACSLVAQALGHTHWKLVYQSRSGPPSQPWLEPDICDHLDALKAGGATDVIVSPIGFLSDHMEVLFDLDTEAKEHCDAIGLNMQRAATPGTHPKFVSMLAELIRERMGEVEKRAAGCRGPNHDVCPVDCCLSGRPATRP